MTEMVQPEKTTIERPAEGGDVQALDARIAQAEGVQAEMQPEAPATNEQTELQSLVANRQYGDAVESDSKIARTDQAQMAETTATGFEKSGVMNNADVQQYLHETLPAEHIRGDRITEIHYPDQYRPEGNSVVLGECSTDKATGVSRIEIYNQGAYGSYDRGKMEQTITHEVGHNVYWNMPEEQRTAWDRLSQASQPTEYVSGYARTNVREDFAESYAAYVRDSELLQEKSSGKYSFMQTHVFQGKEYGN
jgi:hypothetical protein